MNRVHRLHKCLRLASCLGFLSHIASLLSVTGGPISTKLGMLHRGLLSITVFKTDDPGVTLTFLRQGQIWEFGLFNNKK